MTASETNKDSQGRRKTSPSASEYYSRHIHSVSDPSGMLEEEINKLAKRLVRAKALNSAARQLALKERLITKCMRFFYVTGQNVGTHPDDLKHDGSYAQVDDIFIEMLIKAVDSYDASKGKFVNMIRSNYGYRVKDAAYAAAREDTALGGSDQGAPVSLDAQVRRNDDSSTTIGDFVSASEDGESQVSYLENEAEEDERDAVNAVDALEELELLKSDESIACLSESDEATDELMLLKVIALITDFLGNSGRAANDTRKLYTKLFFSETLTRITKVRTVGELEPLVHQEKVLFDTVELPFQDSYTMDKCRTIHELWGTALTDGIPPIMVSSSNSKDGALAPNYNWRLPAEVFIHYLQALKLAASNALVSQQRKKFEELLLALSH